MKVGYRTIKTSIGVIISIYIAKALNLDYYLSAGIITILSIENTKRESMMIAFKRISAFIVAFILSTVLFFILGFYEWVFGLFILIYIPMTLKLKITVGIVVNSVLVTHLLSEKKISFLFIINEGALLVIGVLTALILNTYMPSYERKIKESISIIEGKLKDILINMSESLKNQTVPISEEENFSFLEELIQQTYNLSKMNENNYWFHQDHFYIDHIDMRKQQFNTIKRMREHFQRFFLTLHVTELISDFTKKVANSIKDLKTDNLIEELQTLRQKFKVLPLPNTREEFENRAMLYQFVNDIEQLLLIEQSSMSENLKE